MNNKQQTATWISTLNSVTAIKWQNTEVPVVQSSAVREEIVLPQGDSDHIDL